MPTPVKRSINHSPAVNDLIQRVEYLEKRSEMFSGMLAFMGMAGCDICERHWFYCKPMPTKPGVNVPVLGDANGLLVHDGAVCVHCLDTLYAQSQDWDEDEFGLACENIASWLFLRSSCSNERGYPRNFNMNTEWLRDDRVKTEIQAICNRRGVLQR